MRGREDGYARTDLPISLTFGDWMKHRPELDGLRGIAILLVLGAHTETPGFPAGGGGMGVTLFFVLSGYLITMLLLAERDSSARVDLRAFYIRRALRLFPALAAVILVVAALAITGFMPRAAAEGTDYGVVLVSVMAYLANWAAVSGQSIGIVGHTWSLAVEEQFYILWPMLLLLGLRLGRQNFTLVTLVVIFCVTPYRYALAVHGDYLHLAIGTDARADALLLGCTLALLEIRWSELVGWLGLILIGIVSAAWLVNQPGMDAVFLPAAAIAGTLAVAGCPAILAWRPLAFIGQISYGLYLWHGLVIWWHLPWPLAVALSLGIACLSFFLLERRFLRLKDRFAPRRAPAISQAESAPAHEPA